MKTAIVLILEEDQEDPLGCTAVNLLWKNGAIFEKADFKGRKNKAEGIFKKCVSGKKN